MSDEKAFIGVSDLVAGKPPRSEKDLEDHLSKLYENLATRAVSSTESIEISWTRARIEQTKWLLGRFDSRRVTMREWLSFGTAALGLGVAALTVILR